MNPNWNQSTADAAEAAMRQQTEETVARIESGRQAQMTNPQREAAIAGSLSAVEQVKAGLRTSQPVASIRVKVRERSGGIVTLASDDGAVSVDLLEGKSKLIDEEFTLEFYPVASAKPAEFTHAGAGSGNGGPAPVKDIPGLANPPFVAPKPDVFTADPADTATGIKPKKERLK